MKRRRRVEVTVETDRLLVVSSPGSRRTWCSVCQANTQMVPVDEAALLRQVNSRTIFQWVDEGRVHYVETANGLLRICLNSLAFE